MTLLEETINSIGALDSAAQAEARTRLDSLTKPPGSLGVLEEIVVKLAGITGEKCPVVREKVVIVMAGDHGVVNQGVSAYPQEVTPQMVLNFLNGGAAINVLSRHAEARVVVCDIGVIGEIDAPGLVVKKVRHGTADMTEGPAMTRQEAVRAVEVGIELAQAEIASGAQILGTGDMGIGNTTPSSAILAAFSGAPLKNLVGRGTGLDDGRLEEKRKVIEKALEVNRPDPDDALDVLAKVGGLEIGAIAGTVLGAASRRVPVVIDGFIAGAGALLAARLCPQVTEFMLASHLSEEPGHALILELLDLEPMLTLKMRLGEGTGAALAFHIIDAATRIQVEMATFQEAGVSEKDI